MNIAKNEWRLGPIRQRSGLRTLATAALAVGLTSMIAATTDPHVAEAITCVGSPVLPVPNDGAEGGGGGVADPTIDTQGCVESTRIRVYTNLPDGRRGPDDQFTIGVRRTELPVVDTMTATTVGSESGPQTEADPATGISEYLGPIVTEPGRNYTISQTGAVGSTTDLADYVTTWECVDDNGVFEPVGGTGTEATLATPAVLGADIVCTFTSTPTGGVADGAKRFPLADEAGGPTTRQAAESPIEPTLTVAATSDPVPGSELVAGDEVEYTLTFHNSSVNNPVEVHMVDWLVDVLDDATVTVDPAVVAGEGLSVSAPADGAFTVTGTLAAGSTATATFTVTVNPDRQRGDDRLINRLVRSGEALDVCADGDDRCTEHLVIQPDLAVHKTSNPVSGTGVVAGDPIEYILTFDNTVGTASAVVDYRVDIVDVVDDATVTTAPAVTAGEGLTVSSIDDGVFTVTGELDAGTSATVSYSAAVRPEEERGDDLLTGFLLDPERVKGECVSGDSTCTRHPIPGIDLVTSITTSDDVDNGGTRAGDTVNHTHTVTNTGTNDLVNIGLFDASAPNDMLTCPSEALTVGESMVCSGPGHVVSASDVAAGSIGITVTATAVDGHGTEVSDTDTATVVIEERSATYPLPITGWPAARAIALAAVYLLTLGVVLLTLARSRRRSGR